MWESRPPKWPLFTKLLLAVVWVEVASRLLFIVGDPSGLSGWVGPAGPPRRFGSGRRTGFLLTPFFSVPRDPPGF